MGNLVKIILQDPTDLNEHQHPTTKKSFYLHLNRDWSEVSSRSYLINEAIVSVSKDIEKYEPHHTEYICANCGCALGLTQCSGCKHKFKDDAFRSAGEASLPEKAIDWLKENGHTFENKKKESWIIMKLSKKRKRLYKPLFLLFSLYTRFQ